MVYKEKIMADEVQVTKNVAKYTKSKLLASKKYKNRIDLLTVILQDDNQYTIEEVDKAIKDFMNKKITE